MLRIGELVELTGVGESTLRMWERRHGFPQPVRTVSGHRRYTPTQAELIGQVLRARELGISLGAAIERVRHEQHPLSLSLFATIRKMRPQLQPQMLGKRALIALSHAVEDECLMRAERQILFGCFQRERFYRMAQQRWNQMAQSADAAAVFADFAQPAGRVGAPAEIPLSSERPLMREWGLVCFGARSAVCVVGRESASSRSDDDSAARTFETLWSVDPELVAGLARACALAAGAVIPELIERSEPRLVLTAPSSVMEQTEFATAIINRTLAYI